MNLLIINESLLIWHLTLKLQFLFPNAKATIKVSHLHFKPPFDSIYSSMKINVSHQWLEFSHTFSTDSQKSMFIEQIVLVGSTLPTLHKYCIYYRLYSHLYGDPWSKRYEGTLHFYTIPYRIPLANI